MALHDLRMVKIRPDKQGLGRQNFTDCTKSAIPHIQSYDFQNRREVRSHGDEESSSEEASKEGGQKEEVIIAVWEAAATSPPPFLHFLIVPSSAPRVSHSRSSSAASVSSPQDPSRDDPSFSLIDPAGG